MVQIKARSFEDIFAMHETFYKTYWKITKDTHLECKFREADEEFILKDTGWVDGKGYDETTALKTISRWNRYGYPVVSFSLNELTPETLQEIQNQLVTMEDYGQGKTSNLFELNNIA